MGLAQRLGLRRDRDSEVSGNTCIGFTLLGEKKAELFELKGDMFNVAGVLNEHGPSTVNEIADVMQKNPIKVQRIVDKGIKDGYLRAERVER